MTRKLFSLAIFAILFLSGFTFTTRPLGAGDYLAPSWSPDGDYLAFTFSNLGMDYDVLWLYEARSGRFRRLYGEQDVWGYSGLVWQNDDTLWFVRSGMQDELCSINIVSGQMKDVLHISGIPTFGFTTYPWKGFTFYPDEKHIVF